MQPHAETRYDGIDEIQVETELVRLAEAAARFRLPVADAVLTRFQGLPAMVERFATRHFAMFSLEDVRRDGSIRR